METERETILIVDDIPTNLDLLFEVLNSHGFRVLVAVDGESAIEQAAYAQPDIILLDVMMPGINGFETCQRLKKQEETQDIPVIFMTALSETVDKVKGFEMGAVDYITKPLQHEEVVARVTTHLTLRKLQQRLQKNNDALEERVVQRTAELAELNHNLKREIADRRRAEQTLRAIVEGTATVTGGDFLHSLVRHLATTLKVHTALITECTNIKKTRVRTLSYWEDDGFQENFTYDLMGTPCETAISGQLTYYSENVSEQFPEGPQGFESYIGLPIHDSEGEILGHLAVFDTQTMEVEGHHQKILKIFAARAGAELERQKAEEILNKTNQAYSRFVPREFLQLLRQDSIIDVRLGDQVQMNMTILFADIRSFTTISEKMTPKENFSFLNDYFGRVSPIIREHDGFIDKYIGDAIMALFPNQPDDAIKAAIAMQAEVTSLDLEDQAKNHDPIRVGIGIHTGNLMLGTIGEKERMEGTVISDAVNLASRMEGITKIYGAKIVMSERTLTQLMHSDNYHYRFLDRVQVKGKQNPVSVFEIFSGDPPKQREIKQNTKPEFEQSLLYYYQKNFSQAQKGIMYVLEQNPEDQAAQLYQARIKEFLENGVSSEWRGIETLTSK